MPKRGVVVVAAKLAVTVFILWMVLRQVGVAELNAILSQADWFFVFAAMGLALPLVTTGAQRWRIVAGCLGQRLLYRAALVYTFIAAFFSLGLSTLLTIDAVRTWKLHQQGTSLGLAVRIVATDRLWSLATLLLIIGLALPRLAGFGGDPYFAHAVLLIFIGGMFAFTVLIAFHALGRLVPVPRLNAIIQLSHDFGEILFRRNTATAAIIIWSGCNHFCRVAMVLGLAAALGLDLSLIDALAIVPACLLLAMVPVSVGGWGVREFVFIQGFGLVGIGASGAVAISILYGLVGLCVALLGCLVWMVESKLFTASPKPSLS